MSEKNEDFWTGSDIEMIEVEASEFEKILKIVRPQTTLMCWGGPGIGKTRIIEDSAKERGIKCRTIVTSTYEPTDIGGIPFPVTEEGATKYVEYLVAHWAFEASVESGETEPMVLFFDDLPTAHEQVQAACYRLMLEGEIGSVKLRSNVQTIGAGNRPEDNAATHNMPTPLGNRMLHIYIRPGTKAWLEWAVGKGGIHPWVVGFIRTHSDQLYKFVPDAAEKAFASPRSIEMLSNTIYDLEKNDAMSTSAGSLAYKLSAGCVGTGWTVAFFEWIKMAEKSISPEKIIANPEKVHIPDDIDVMHATIASCEKYLNEHPEVWEPMLQFAVRLEPEFALILGYTFSNIVLYKLSGKEQMRAVKSPALTKMFNEMKTYTDK